MPTILDALNSIGWSLTDDDLTIIVTYKRSDTIKKTYFGDK